MNLTNSSASPQNASPLEQIRKNARAVWSAGDYPTVARRQLWPVGERIVAHVAVRPGEDVLDVACGTGNAALRAAGAGARTVGVDLTPELFKKKATRKTYLSRTKASTSCFRSSDACSPHDNPRRRPPR